MAYPAYLRERARELRVKNKLSLNEIAERLALPKTTVYYWIKDLPLGRERRWSVGQRKGNRSMQNKWRLLREAAYAQGQREWDELSKIPTFRDLLSSTSLRVTSGVGTRRPSATLIRRLWPWRPVGSAGYPARHRS
jgi:transcriptional regulator with XRE-family HTH domain